MARDGMAQYPDSLAHRNDHRHPAPQRWRDIDLSRYGVTIPGPVQYHHAGGLQPGDNLIRCPHCRCPQLELVEGTVTAAGYTVVCLGCDRQTAFLTEGV